MSELATLAKGTISIHFTGDRAYDGLNGKLDIGIKQGATGNSLIASINANGSATIEEKSNRVTVEVPIISNPSGSYYASMIGDETGEPAITGSLLNPHTKFFITIEEDTTWYVCKDRPITTEDFTLINQSYRCNRYIPYALNTGLERDYPIPLSEALKRLQGVRNTGNYQVTLHFLPWYEYLEGGSEFGSSVGIEEELSRYFEWVNIRGVENTPLLLRSDDYNPTESSNPLITIELLDIAYGCKVQVRELGIHSITSYQSDVTLTDTLLQLSPDLIPVIADRHSTFIIQGDIRLTHSGWSDDPVPNVYSLLDVDNQSVVNLDSVVFHLEEDITVDSSVSTIHCERGSIVNLSYLPSTAGLGAIHGKQFSMGEGCIFSTTGWTGNVNGEGKPDIDFSSGATLSSSLMALGDVEGDVWLAIGTGTGDGQDGLSAYQVAVRNGFVGTEIEWLASLVGEPGLPGADGDDGADGLSAYQIAVSNGFVGDEAAWLATFGQNGLDGDSAYEVAIANGFVGDEAAWLLSLKGVQGDPGFDGVDGLDGADGAVGSVSSASGLTLTQIATPAEPSAGNTIVYAKNDGKLYTFPAGGVETELGDAGVGGTFDPLTDKALYYYDAGSGLFKPVGIGTAGQTLIAQPASNPPYQWAAPSGGGGGREVLTADRIYYVRTDGNDSNDGLSDTAGGAFATIARFFDALCKVDKNGFNVVGQVKDGTYTITETVMVKDGVGDGNVTLRGNTTTPTNVVISSANNITYISKRTNTTLTIEGFYFLNIASNDNVVFLNLVSGLTLFKNLNFGATTTGANVSQSHIQVAGGATCIPIGNYTVSGKSCFHILVSNISVFRDSYILQPPGIPFNLTVTGTPEFTYFVYCYGGTYSVGTQTVVGTATGNKYGVTLNGVLSGGNNLPGSGTVVSLGGQVG